MPVSMSGQADLFFVKPGLFLMVFASFFFTDRYFDILYQKNKARYRKGIYKGQRRKESIFIGYLSDHSHPVRNKLNKKK